MANTWAAFNLPFIGIAAPPQQSTDLLDVQKIGSQTVRQVLQELLTESATPTAAQIADEVWNNIDLEGSYSGKELMRLIAAAAAATFTDTEVKAVGNPSVTRITGTWGDGTRTVDSVNVT